MNFGEIPTKAMKKYSRHEECFLKRITITAESGFKTIVLNIHFGACKMK